MAHSLVFNCILNRVKEISPVVSSHLLTTFLELGVTLHLVIDLQWLVCLALEFIYVIKSKNFFQISELNFLAIPYSPLFPTQFNDRSLRLKRVTEKVHRTFYRFALWLDI